MRRGTADDGTEKRFIRYPLDLVHDNEAFDARAAKRATPNE